MKECLLIKVIPLLGVYGECSKEELYYLTVDTGKHMLYGCLLRLLAKGCNTYRNLKSPFLLEEAVLLDYRHKPKRWNPPC